MSKFIYIFKCTVNEDDVVKTIPTIPPYFLLNNIVYELSPPSSQTCSVVVRKVYKYYLNKQECIQERHAYP